MTLSSKHYSDVMWIVSWFDFGNDVSAIVEMFKTREKTYTSISNTGPIAN